MTATVGPSGWRAVRDALVIAGVVALLIPGLVGLVRGAGIAVPSPDILQDFATGALWAAALGASILVWPVRAGDRLPLLAAWTVKAAVALGFMLVYERTYGGQGLDAFLYYAALFEPSLDALGEQVGMNVGTTRIQQIVRLHGAAGLPWYHAIKVTFAMIGLVGVYLYYRTAALLTGRESPRVLLGLAFFPSVLFWSSILGKDPVVFTAIALHTYGVVAWIRGRGARWLVLAALGVYFAATIRLWLGPIMVVPILVVAARAARTVRARAGIAVAGLAATASAVLALRDRLALETLGDLMSMTNTVSRGWAEGGSGQVLPELTSPAAALAFMPRGMFTALFRPLPGEVMNAFGMLAGLENLVLLSLLGLAVARTRGRDLRDPVVVWAIVFVLVWAGFYGFLSSQNLGTAVRFRLQILPVLLGLLLGLARRRTPPNAAHGEPPVPPTLTARYR